MAVCAALWAVEAKLTVARLLGNGGKSWSAGDPASWGTMLREARIPRCESGRRPRLGDAFTKSGMGCGEFTPRLEEWRDKLASTNPDGPNCRLRDCCGMGEILVCGCPGVVGDDVTRGKNSSM